VPSALLSSTIQAGSLFAAGGMVSAKVTALAEGVMHTMFLSKLKIATALVLAIGVLGTGTGLVPSSWGNAETQTTNFTTNFSQEENKDDRQKKVEEDKKKEQQQKELGWKLLRPRLDLAGAVHRDVVFRRIVLELDDSVQKQLVQRSIELKIQALNKEMLKLKKMEEKERLERLMRELVEAVDQQKKETARMEKLVKELKDAVDKQKDVKP